MPKQSWSRAHFEVHQSLVGIWNSDLGEESRNPGENCHSKQKTEKSTDNFH